MDRRDFCEVLASLAHIYTKLTGNLMTELRSRESLLLAVSTKIPTFALTQQVKTNKGKKMISKARIRLIHALEMRKHRLREGLFVAEGPRLVGEMLRSVSPAYLAATDDWFAENRHLLCGKLATDVVSESELRQASLLRTPQQVLALFPLAQDDLDNALPQHQLCLVLD